MSVAIEDMLSDTEPIELASKEIPASFRCLNSTPLSRGEAVELIKSSYIRRPLAPDVLEEVLECLIRANAPTTEKERCYKARSSTILGEAITVLHIMCHMSQKTPMKSVYTALQNAGVPEDLIQGCQSASLLHEDVNHFLWQKWLIGEDNQKSLDPRRLGTPSHPYLEDIVIAKSVAEGQNTEIMMLDKNGSEEVVDNTLYRLLHCMPSPCSEIVNDNSIDCQEILNRLGPSASIEVQEAFRCAQGDIVMALIQLRVKPQVAVVACASVDHLGCNSNFNRLLLAYAQATGLLLSNISHLYCVKQGDK